MRTWELAARLSSEGLPERFPCIDLFIKYSEVMATSAELGQYLH